MEITLEQIDQIKERTNVSTEQAKAALEKANGDIVDAIILLEKGEESESEKLIDKLKKLIKEGNVKKITMTREGKEILSVPLNVGLVGGIIGVAAAPWAVIASAIAAYGFDCKFELTKTDGSKEIIAMDEEETDEAPKDMPQEEQNEESDKDSTDENES